MNQCRDKYDDAGQLVRKGTAMFDADSTSFTKRMNIELKKKHIVTSFRATMLAHDGRFGTMDLELINMKFEKYVLLFEFRYLFGLCLRMCL